MTSVVTAVASEEKEKRRLLQRQREEVIELRPGRAAGITAAIQVARFSEFVRIVVLIAAVAAFLWLCASFGIGLLPASLALITVAVCGVLARYVPEQYRLYYYLIVIAATALIIGLLMKGVVPLSAVALVGGEFTTYLEAVVANTSLYVMLVIAPLAALILRLIAEKSLLASIFKVRRAEERSTEFA
jgi:hypothetical protein